MIENFKNRNVVNIEKLNHHIDVNSNNIRMILTSPEMYEWLKLFDECNVKEENIIFYKNILVTKIDYFGTGGVDFLYKETPIIFNMPCVCGFYHDEQHP